MAKRGAWETVKLQGEQVVDEVRRLIHEGKLKGAPPGSFAFCHVREVARAHVAAAEQGKNGANYLLGGTHASFLEMTQIMAIEPTRC